MNVMWDLAKFSHNTAVIDETGVSHTYSELSTYIKQIEEIICERNLVLCLCQNNFESLLGYIACVQTRNVPLLIESETDSQLLQNLVKVYSPSFIWMPAKYVEIFSSIEIVHELNDYVLVKTKRVNKKEIYKELALLLTTSGSTGSKKLVRVSYKNIAANIDSILNYLEITENDRSITTLPMSYTYGLSIINTFLAAGASLILTEKSLMQKEFWQQFKNYEATSLSGVPYTYEMLRKLKFFRMSLPSLKVMTQAGGRLSSDLQKLFAEYAKENDIRFYVMYGQTEATARMSYLPFEKSIEKSGSIGIAIPNGRFYLVDNYGNNVQDTGVVGELAYEGENVTLGYANNADDLKKGDERNGRLLTGDMAKIDSDGYYWIVGRKKRFLKVFGRRVNLDEIEELLKIEFSGSELACGGIDDKVYIFVVNDFNPVTIKNYISEKTGLNPFAFEVERVDKIPKNESGKTEYGKLPYGSIF